MKDGTPASTWAKTTPGARRSSHKGAEVGNVENSIINEPHTTLKQPGGGKGV